MADLLFVAVLGALFGVTALFIQLCDRMIGADEEAFADSPPAEAGDDLPVAA